MAKRGQSNNRARAGNKRTQEGSGVMGFMAYVLFTLGHFAFMLTQYSLTQHELFERRICLLVAMFVSCCKVRAWFLADPTSKSTMNFLVYMAFSWVDFFGRYCVLNHFMGKPLCNPDCNECLERNVLFLMVALFVWSACNLVSISEAFATPCSSAWLFYLGMMQRAEIFMMMSVFFFTGEKDKDGNAEANWALASDQSQQQEWVILMAMVSGAYCVWEQIAYLTQKFTVRIDRLFWAVMSYVFMCLVPIGAVYAYPVAQELIKDLVPLVPTQAQPYLDLTFLDSFSSFLKFMMLFSFGLFGIWRSYFFDSQMKAMLKTFQQLAAGKGRKLHDD